MQRILRFEEAYKAESIIDNMALQKGVLKDYLEKRRTAAFESYVNFNLCSFDFYDVDSTLVDTARVLLYLDREDLIIFCEDERTSARAGIRQGNGASWIFHSTSGKRYGFYRQLGGFHYRG